MTPLQNKLLGYISSYINETGGVSPSYAEMAEFLNLKSKAGINRLVTGLAKRGHISYLPGYARSIMLKATLTGCCPTCGQFVPTPNTKD